MDNLSMMPGIPEAPELPEIPKVVPHDEEETKEEVAVEENVTEEVSTEKTEEPKELLDEENPLTNISMRELGKLLSQVGDMVKTTEENWLISKKEFELNDTHMKAIFDYNENHKKSMPEDLTEEEKENWDLFNGLDEIPEETVEEIFGEGHPIIGVMNSQTIDRLKMVAGDFYAWITSLKEYKSINNAYMQLIEQEEDKEINDLIDRMNNTEDEEAKAKMQASIDKYFNRKYLDFLAEPLTEMEVDRLVKAYYDKNKIEYWINRTRDRLKQMKIAPKCILEISKFEKRFLPEKYHDQSNIFLLYFMTVVIHSDPNDKNNENNTKAMCMIIALDRIIRNTASEESKTHVIDNMCKFEDQFIGKLKDPKENDEEVVKETDENNE